MSASSDQPVGPQDPFAPKRVRDQEQTRPLPERPVGRPSASGPTIHERGADSWHRRRLHRCRRRSSGAPTPPPSPADRS